ncbi:MAG: pentapeptide repeat-containing protein [Deltaproteobacteria bacterium]|nr:pentapeptide repeat-containing protein [Deltaproteobacteria bacterium]
MEQEKAVILTEDEKKTELIGGWFQFEEFTGLDLSGVVFRETHLEEAKFVDADLRRADFRGANLQGAVFAFCDVRGADFTDARLEGADLRTSFGLSPEMREYIRSRGGLV